MKLFGKKITVSVKVTPATENIKPYVKESIEADLAYVELNNTFLAVERGTLSLTRGVKNRLGVLIDRVYPYYKEPVMNEYWYNECEKLPGWLEL